jgi:hypothetical protein
VWKFIRITALLLVLVGVAATTWLDRVSTTSWKSSLWVGVFPMNADGSEVTEQYIRTLGTEDFASLETFFADESARHGLRVERPVRIELYPSPRELPPMLPPNANALQAAWWSLELRWFARGAADVPGRAPSHIRIFVLFHDPTKTAKVPHSHGLQKGLVGVVHAFADAGMTGSNNVVIAHEAMHTLGATDKYDVLSGAPTYPGGYAEPDRQPRFPQSYAEIMAGRRALSEREHEMPENLRDVRVGRDTAAEIGWSRE